ncbi:MAG: hypothetical protein K2N05_10820 [Muribaculaceae bacterium]|nr:hypothetical protein [Muribaculaceae bacterium]
MGEVTPPNGNVYVPGFGGSGGSYSPIDIKINYNNEQLRKRFMKDTGKEYSEYLASKK